MSAKCWSKKKDLKVSNHVKNPGVQGTIMISILNKCVMLTKFIWLRAGPEANVVNTEMNLWVPHHAENSVT
jgi:hypothetical protein